jgi:hypothetical protein
MIPDHERHTLSRHITCLLIPHIRVMPPNLASIPSTLTVHRICFIHAGACCEADTLRSVADKVGCLQVGTKAMRRGAGLARVALYSSPEALRRLLELLQEVLPVDHLWMFAWHRVVLHNIHNYCHFQADCPRTLEAAMLLPVPHYTALGKPRS